MEFWQVLISLLVVCTFVLIAVVRVTRLREEGKYQRTLANSAEKTNREKLSGLFELEIAKISNLTQGEGNEFAQALELLSKIPGNGSVSSPPGAGSVSWDILKDQLRNPEIKKTLLANKDEALKILME